MNPHQTIGFITGGQLGKMMMQSFLPFRQFETLLVLDGSPDCPCSCIADEVIVGSSKDYMTVLEFGKKCDTLILEFEHVDVQALKDLKSLGKRIIAQPEYVEIIQDKSKQKQFLADHNIPTAQSIKVENKAEIQNIKDQISFPCIQKTCFDGYDGGGVLKLDSKDEIPNAFDTPSILEECVNIEKEFSLILGRDDFGTEFRYPIIEQSFHSQTNIVDTVWFAESVSEDVLLQVDMIAEKILTAFSGTGMYAIELFLDTDKKVLVNEIAPRVHNSGHHTIEGCVTSQFEQYMRVALGYNSGSTEVIVPSVMVNILGENDSSGPTDYIGMKEMFDIENVHVHLYGKKETKPHRKMGHVTVTGSDYANCIPKIEQIKNTLLVKSV